MTIKRKIKRGDDIEEIEFMDEDPLAEDLKALRSENINLQGKIEELNKKLLSPPGPAQIVPPAPRREKRDLTFIEIMEGESTYYDDERETD